MIDSATYNAAEARAREAVSSWTWPAMMVPGKFDAGRFPTRVETLHEIRPLLDAMHQNRFEPSVRELNGLSVAEIDEFLAALNRFCEFALLTFQDPVVVLPLNTLMAEFLVSRKLRALPRRDSVLEIGAGCGYLPFFCSADAGFATRAQIEVTQSLYLLQSKVNHFLYGRRFEDMALQPLQTVAIGGLSNLARTRHPWHERQAHVKLSVTRDARLFPWWKIDTCMDGSTRFDVVVSNANIREMSYPAFLYYFAAITNCLAPDGVVLIQDLGARPSNPEVETAMFKALDAQGFRPLVNANVSTPGATFATHNLLLVREGHPHWNDAGERCADQHFPLDIPLVRSVYGLDRAKGEFLDRGTLFQLFRQRLG